MEFKFEVEHDERVYGPIFIISWRLNDNEEGGDLIINSYNDPYEVFYASANTPSCGTEFFERELFKYLREKYPEYF